ncbi:MAG: hypothetical protein ACRD82_04120 [Blastocatellia bacterium]
MWKTAFEVFKRLFTINDDLNRFQADLKKHSEQIRELADNQTRLQYEWQLQRERDAHEREKEKMQFENLLLRERLERSEQRTLPPPPSDKKQDGE